MMQSTDVKLSDIQPGPIPHAELPPELTERIKAFKAILGYVDPSSLEYATDNFKRDMHPEPQVEVWERIARAYQALIRCHHIADHQMRREDHVNTVLGATNCPEQPQRTNSCRPFSCPIVGEARHLPSQQSGVLSPHLAR